MSTGHNFLHRIGCNTICALAATVYYMLLLHFTFLETLRHSSTALEVRVVKGHYIREGHSAT